MLMIAPRIAEIDFAVLDNRIGPIGDIQSAIGPAFHIDWPEGHIWAPQQVGQFASRISCTLFFDSKSHYAVRPKIAGDRIALPVRRKLRAANDFQSAELGVIARA